MKNSQYKSFVYKETSNSKDPFLTEEIYIKGYNLNEELLPKIDFLDWIGVSFFKNKPSKETKEIISKLPLLISNKGFKDPGILSASMASATNNPDQNCLLSFISSSGGLYKGAKEVERLLSIFQKLERKDSLFSIESIYKEINKEIGREIDSYGIINHTLGFNEWTNQSSKRILTILDYFSNFDSLKLLKFIKHNKEDIEIKFDKKIDLELIISAIFYDIELELDSLEFFYFFLLIPFANIIKKDQNKLKNLPFYNEIFLEKQ